jgi:hypothetical protein
MSAPPRAASAAPAPSATSWTASAPPAAPAEKKRAPVWLWVGGAVVATVAVLAVIGAMLPEQPQQVASVSPQPASAAPAGAPPVDYRQQILNRLAQVEQAFAAQGFQRLAEPVSGQLPQGQYANVPINLEVGGDYRIIGVCDNDCGDLDLFLYDQNNNIVSQDNLTDATPVVSVAPQWSGPFVVQAVMHNCTVAPCFYALVLYGRPMQ